MGHENNRDALPRVELLKQSHDLVAGGGIEIARGLVGENQRRPIDQARGDRDPLLLAAGKLVGHMVEAFIQSN